MALAVKKLVVGQLATNCYLVYPKTSSTSRKPKTIIIDPGDDAEYIQNKINDLDLTPELIVATHGHFDHLLAVNELKLIYKIPFSLPKKDEVMFKWYRRSTKHFLGFDPGPAPTVDQYLDRELSTHNFQFSVIETPGHTPGGVCLYSKKDNLLFSGDTIFAGGAIGRYDFPYASKAKLDQSIKKLLKLPEKTIVYPGHGEETTIEEFRKLYPQA